MLISGTDPQADLIARVIKQRATRQTRSRDPGMPIGSLAPPRWGQIQLHESRGSSPKLLTERSTFLKSSSAISGRPGVASNMAA
jgi:hypothetical protein